MLGVDRRHDVFLARPQAHRCALGGEKLGECRAPGAATDDAELFK